MNYLLTFSTTACGASRNANGSGDKYSRAFAVSRLLRLLGIYPPAQRALRRVHWSKEASSLGFAVPYGSHVGINRIYHWIIETMVEAIIRRWCCQVGRNGFISRR
jgi:hypothetical protein